MIAAAPGAAGGEPESLLDERAVMSWPEPFGLRAESPFDPTPGFFWPC